MENNNPYLIQRLTLNATPRETAKGVDRAFRMDYMGSAEFEFGALPRSLKRMRETAKPEIQRIKVDGRIVWFVGSQEHLETAEQFFRDQLNTGNSNRRIKLKEASRISEVFMEPGSDAPYVGWWDIEHDWSFFTKKDFARAWIKAVWG